MPLTEPKTVLTRIFTTMRTVRVRPRRALVVMLCIFTTLIILSTLFFHSSTVSNKTQKLQTAERRLHNTNNHQVRHMSREANTRPSSERRVKGNRKGSDHFRSSLDDEESERNGQAYSNDENDINRKAYPQDENDIHRKAYPSDAKDILSSKTFPKEEKDINSKAYPNDESNINSKAYPRDEKDITSNSHSNDISRNSHPWMFGRSLDELLINHPVPNQAFYVWCQNTTFTFQHYLSVLSVWKLLEPDKLQIFKASDMQNNSYHQWLQELIDTIPALEIIDIPAHDVHLVCKAGLYGLSFVSDRGGLFVDFSTVLLKPLDKLRRANFSLGVQQDGLSGNRTTSFVLSTAKHPFLQQVLALGSNRSPQENQAKLVNSVPAPQQFRCPSVVRESGSVKLQTGRGRSSSSSASKSQDSTSKSQDPTLNNPHEYTLNLNNASSSLTKSQESASKTLHESNLNLHSTHGGPGSPISDVEEEEKINEEEILCATLPRDLDLQPLDLWTVKRDSGVSMLMDLYYLRLGPAGNVVGPFQSHKTDSSLHAANLQDVDTSNDDNKPVLDAEKSGTESGIAVQAVAKEAIPFIVHYVWFGEALFSFRMYLSFVSTIYVARAERVFLHTDMLLKGPYWALVKTHPKVTLVYRERPSTIYGHKVLYTQHFSDITRADVLDKYGGVYIDWDALWLRSPAKLLAAAEGQEWGTLVNIDHMTRPNFRDVLNMGVVAARPRAAFIRLWRRELRHYKTKDFFHNALELPYKVHERYPWTVRIEKRLQVMCYFLKCHPIFDPGYRDWDKAQPFDWRTDVYAIHFTHPDPDEYDSLEKLRAANGTFAEIGRFILDSSKDMG